MIRSLQERYAPKSTCFGCGPANPGGLRIHSVVEGDTVVTRFHARPEHEAFAGYLNGGIAGTIADCGMNWAAIHFLMEKNALTAAPPTVTLEYSMRFRRPVPTTGQIELRARATDVDTGRATIEATIVAGGRECATARGTFVIVKEGHPAYGRWRSTASSRAGRSPGAARSPARG